jgi:hypothetical protein
MRLRLATALLVLAAGSASARAQDSTRARVRGVVFDSVAGAPLPGARVLLVPVADPARSYHSAPSGPDGQYAIEGLPVGRYLAGFEHPLLDSLGLSSPEYQVDITRPGALALDMAVPSAPRIHDAICGRNGPADSTGLLLGTLLDARAGGAAARGTITARWIQFTFDQSHIVRTPVERAVQAGTGGWYAICGVPASTPFRVVASAGADSSGEVMVQVPLNGLLRQNLFVGGSVVRVVPLGDSATPTAVRRGTSRLSGVVRTTDKRPIAAAQVEVLGTGLSALTNDSGSFSLDELPAGTQAVVTRKVGYYPDERPVTLRPDSVRIVSIEMPTITSVLDTVRTTASRMFNRGLAEFNERRRTSGAGYFVDSDAIDKLGARDVVQVLYKAPNISIVPFALPDKRIVYRVRVHG